MSSFDYSRFDHLDDSDDEPAPAPAPRAVPPGGEAVLSELQRRAATMSTAELGETIKRFERLGKAKTRVGTHACR